MNENPVVLKLRSFMDDGEGWGRAQGRNVYGKLIGFVEKNPGVLIFRVSLEGVDRVDISFASETLVELASRFRSRKGFSFVDLTDTDMLENWEAAAERKRQPLMVWSGEEVKIIGPRPKLGAANALAFALKRSESRASEFAATVDNMSIANASMKFKQLWEEGFLLRREDVAGSGGTEFVYYRIK